MQRIQKKTKTKPTPSYTLSLFSYIVLERPKIFGTTHRARSPKLTSKHLFPRLNFNRVGRKHSSLASIKNAQSKFLEKISNLSPCLNPVCVRVFFICICASDKVQQPSLVYYSAARVNCVKKKIDRTKTIFHMR